MESLPCLEVENLFLWVDKRAEIAVVGTRLEEVEEALY